MVNYKLLKDKRILAILVIAVLVFLGSIMALQESEEYSILVEGSGDPPSIRIIHSETIDHDVDRVLTYTMYVIIYVTDGDDVDLDGDGIFDIIGDIIDIKIEYSYPPVEGEDRLWIIQDTISTATPEKTNNPFIKTYTYDFTDTSSSISIRVYATDSGGNQVFERKSLGVIKSSLDISFDITLLALVPIFYFIRKRNLSSKIDKK